MRFYIRKANKWRTKYWVVRDKKQHGAVVTGPMRRDKAEQYANTLNYKEAKK